MRTLRLPASTRAAGVAVGVLTALGAIACTSPGPVSADPDLVDSADYYRMDNYFFTSPSGRWDCGVLIDSHYVGCHGPIPESAPDAWYPVDEIWLRPNTVIVAPGEPAEFIHRGDPAYRPTDGFEPARTLPYGKTLRVGNIDCTVEPTGVTCDDTVTGHGFTVSDQEYRLR